MSMSAIESEHHEALYQAVRTILRGFHEGIFVRNIQIDAHPDWVLRVLPHARIAAEQAAYEITYRSIAQTEKTLREGVREGTSPY